jgi:ectoine hydroxylase-related dioxygenase (phytanoyl-CoA dioxygenase family)
VAYITQSAINRSTRLVQRTRRNGKEEKEKMCQSELIIQNLMLFLKSCASGIAVKYIVSSHFKNVFIYSVHILASTQGTFIFRTRGPTDIILTGSLNSFSSTH